jgi:hypothetical protein
MFSAPYLLTFCSFVSFGKALPTKDISTASATPVQAILKHPKPANLRSIGPLLVQVQDNGISKAQTVITEFTKEADQTLLTPALAESFPWPRALYLSSSCEHAWFGKLFRVRLDTCFKIAGPYLKITKPAICPDGTHAKLAVYDDEQCGSMLFNAQLPDELATSCLQIDIALEYLRQTDWKRMKSLKVLCKDSPEYNKSLARDASIKLFAASIKNYDPIGYDFCVGTNYNTISLPAETCLSGDYYLSNNVLIEEEPLCTNGQVLVFIYYKARGCVGKVQYSSTARSPRVCIWSTLQPRYWSMIWRCGTKPYLYDRRGAGHHQAAVAPPPPYPDAPKGAVIIQYLTPNCIKQPVGGNVIVPTGDCLATPGLGMRVLEPAICKNGTRAQLARFQDDHCGGGTISWKYGLVDINDDDVGGCVSTGPIDSRVGIGSVAFWCDELRPNK